MSRKEIELELLLELPDDFENYDEHTQLMVLNYLKQLDKIEKKAYTIGKLHLGSSFNLLKSNGFAVCKEVYTFIQQCAVEKYIEINYDPMNPYSFDYKKISKTDLFKIWKKKK